MNHAHKLGLNVLVRLACLVIVLSTTSTAWAVLLAYEGFDYTPDTLLVTGGVGLNGGSGWAGAWDESQAASFATVVQATSLGYTDSLGNVLATAGGKLLNTGAGDGVTSQISQPGRTLAARRGSATSGDTISTWISFLGQRVGAVNMDDPPNPNGFDGTYRRGANLALFDLNTETPAAVTEKFNIGESSNQQYPLGGTPPAYEDRFQTRIPGVPATVIVPQPFAQNPEGSATSNANGAQIRDAFTNAKFKDLSLIVVRIDHVTGDSNAATTPAGGTFGGNDNIHVWTNPILSSTPSDASASVKHISADIVAAANALAVPVAPFNGNPTTTGSGSGGEFDFDRIRLFAGNVAGTTPFAEWLFDEFRVGTTFADVAPITAPAGTIGDYNGDLKVDAADYTVWRNNLNGLGSTLLNRDPANGSGAVSQDDYASWKTHFGEPAGAGSFLATGVPEPTTLLLVGLGLIAASAIRRRND